MKYTQFCNLFTVILALLVAGVGCKHKKEHVTPIPGGMTGKLGGESTFGKEPGPGATLPSEPPTTVRPGPGGEIPLTAMDLEKMDRNPEFFKANTVHFEFDRATIRPTETSKIDGVVDYLKGHATHAVQIEGHCDERGTEQYNLSLGERRALAVREYVVTAGIAAERVATISYGESKPVDSAHNEAAWVKNRRAEFVLLTPK